jgi:hypothetical protein
VPNCQVTKSPSSGSRRAPRSRTVSVSQCFEEGNFYISTQLLMYLCVMYHVKRMSRNVPLKTCPSSPPITFLTIFILHFLIALGGRKTVDEVIPQPLIHKFSDEASIALEPRPPISEAASVRYVRLITITLS